VYPDTVHSLFGSRTQVIKQKTGDVISDTSFGLVTGSESAPTWKCAGIFHTSKITVAFMVIYYKQQTLLRA
jgi:hypothetical protein